MRNKLYVGWNFDPRCCLEITDFLEFLTGHALYYRPAQFVLPDTGRAFPPFCGDSTYWHCTRQSDWVMASSMTSTNAEEREVFAMTLDKERLVG